MRFLLTSVFLTLTCVANWTWAQAYTCIEDNECLFSQYCDRVTTYSCQPCKDCRPYRRYSGYAPCVRNIISDCGSCMDGYEEVREYFTDARVETCSPSNALITTPTLSMSYVIIVAIITTTNMAI